MPAMASAYLDALRAIAANLVVAAHILTMFFGLHDPWSFGALGITVFFLLSGFLITQSMLRWAQRPEPRAPGFFADRVARIFTPYAPALVIIALVNLVVIDRPMVDGVNTGPVTFVGNLLLLQDHAIYQFMEIAGIDVPWRIQSYNTAEPFWTVAVEMWIYVAVGLFFFCLLKGEPIRWSLSLVLAAACIPVIVWNAAAGGGKSLTLIWLVGAVAGLLFHLWRTHGYLRHRLIGVALIVLGAVALIGRSGKIGFDPYDLQTATLIAMIIFGALAVLIGVARAPALLTRPAVFFASYSYSLYLMHNTVLIIVLDHAPIADAGLKAATAAVVAHICAFVLYMLFERHYRSVGKWLRPQFERWFAPRRSARPEGHRA